MPQPLATASITFVSKIFLRLRSSDSESAGIRRRVVGADPPGSDEPGCGWPHQVQKRALASKVWLQLEQVILTGLYIFRWIARGYLRNYWGDGFTPTLTLPLRGRGFCSFHRQRPPPPWPSPLGGGDFVLPIASACPHPGPPP